MRTVNPLRNLKQISQIKNILRGSGEIRDLLWFEFGINSALRASDLLRVKVGDVFTPDGSTREFFELHEQKTGKRTKIVFTPKVRETLREYREKYPVIVTNPDNYLFFAKKRFPLGTTHIGRIQMWKIINRLANSIGIHESVGAHSLRKTFAYQARQHGVPIELIQHRLNHASPSVTLFYMGIQDEELMEVCNRLDF